MLMILNFNTMEYLVPNGDWFETIVTYYTVCSRVDPYMQSES